MPASPTRKWRSRCKARSIWFPRLSSFSALRVSYHQLREPHSPPRPPAHPRLPSQGQVHRCGSAGSQSLTWKRAAQPGFLLCLFTHLRGPRAQVDKGISIPPPVTKTHLPATSPSPPPDNPLGPACDQQKRHWLWSQIEMGSKPNMTGHVLPGK